MAVASPALERVRAGEALNVAGASTPTVSSPAMVSSPFTPLDASKGPTGVVIEVGAVFVRCGFAGESRPRHFIHTPLSIRERLASHLEVPQNGMGEGAEEEPWRSDLRAVLYDIFFNLLQANPPERPVVVCESLLTPQFFRVALADLLLGFLQVPSVLFVPSKGVALVPLQLQTALVVDCGYHATRVLPIVLGAHIVHALTTTVLAGKTLNDRLRALLDERAVVVNQHTKTSQPCERLPEAVVEDIKVRLCSIPPHPPDQAGFTNEKLLQKMRYELSGEEAIDVDVHTCVYAGEALFETDGDEGEASVAAAVLDALARSPIDARCALAQNILVIGGTCRVPGFRRRLLHEIERLVGREPAYAAFRALADQFCVLDPSPFAPHHLSWLGGAFVGCVEHDQAITQAQYAEGKHKFPDWLRVAEAKRVTKERRNAFMVAPPSAAATPAASTPRRRLISLALSGASSRNRLRESFASSLAASSTPYTPPTTTASTALDASPFVPSVASPFTHHAAAAGVVPPRRPALSSVSSSAADSTAP